MLLDEDFYHEMMDFFFDLLASFYAQVTGLKPGPGSKDGAMPEIGSKVESMR